jgi:hypothetical protein
VLAALLPGFPLPAGARQPHYGNAAQGNSDKVERRVECPAVISAAARSVSRRPGKVLDISKVAATLGTSKVWVERCLSVYGRRSHRPGQESAESRELIPEIYEAEEPEEKGVEEAEEPGDLPADREKQQRIPPTPKSHDSDNW